jgi:hypothetical protein
LTTEPSFALLKFTAHLTKSFSLEVARLFRLEENSYGLDTVARRRMEIRVDAQRGESRFVFLHSNRPARERRFARMERKIISAAVAQPWHVDC